MRKIKTVLRLYHQCNFSRRAIATSQGIAYGTVDNYLKRAAEAGITWPLPPGIGERELGNLLFPSQPLGTQRDGFAKPDFFHIQTELKLVGMTKLLAWEEYREAHPEHGYSYSQFCHRFNVWRGQQRRSMRQLHVAGEKCFVDYCGPTIPIVNVHTGEYLNAQVFVAVLGASNYTFAHGSASQTQADWISSHVKAFEFFGGMTALVIPDNLKSGVIKADRYVPTLKALPRTAYEYVDVRRARVHIDYHIEYDRHYYSVPHALVKSEVEVRASNKLVSVYAHGQRVACHPRSTLQAGHSTLSEHMPRAHQAIADWSSERFELWASDIGPATLHVVHHQLNRKRHQEQSYRSVLALLSLAKRYDRVRLENACQRALVIGSPTRTSVTSILKNGIDLHPTMEQQQALFDDDEHLQSHDNIRGAQYFH